MGQAIAFYVLAALILGFAVLVVSTKNTVHAVLFLVLNFLAVAALYVLLTAQFIAVIQVLVYAGGIVVLYLFVVMLVNLKRPPEDHSSPQRRPWLGFGLSALVLGQLAAILLFGGFKANIRNSMMTINVRAGGHLQIQHRDFYLYGTGNPTAYGLPRYQELVDAIRKDPELAPLLAVVTPRLQLGGVAGNFEAAVSATVLGVAYVAERAFRKPALGLGDVHMMAMVGAFVGISGALLTVFLGSLLGLLIGVPLMGMRGRLTLLGTYLPLGTFLAMGAAVAYGWGDALIGWYLAYAFGTP